MKTADCKTLPEVAAQFRSLVNPRRWLVRRRGSKRIPIDAAALAASGLRWRNVSGRKLNLSVQQDQSLIGGIPRRGGVMKFLTPPVKAAWNK